MLYRACVQRYMYKRNTVHSIPCQRCPKKYVGQTTATIKERCSENRNLNFKEESWNCFSLSWKGTRYWFWVYTNYCRRKAYWKRLIMLIEGIEIKKLSQAERAHLQIYGMWNWPHLGHLYRIDQNLTAMGVEVRRRMKVQQLLRNEMLVQCSSEFFVTLLIAADEDCLVQSKRTATKYIIFHQPHFFRYIHLYIYIHVYIYIYI